MVKVRTPCAKRIDTNPKTRGRLLDSRPRRRYSCHGGRQWLTSAWRLPIERDTQRASMANKYNLCMYLVSAYLASSQSHAAASGGRPSQARE